MLTAVFVDYDNIYLSLKKKNEEAARRFAKDSALWLKEIEQGRLITPTNSCALPGARRIVMNRCYGNPAPRRNAADNSTDMSSFPFVRHHFLRAGFEVMDCPPLTAQLKNSADIRMVMEVRDLLDHPTRFEEFILLSGDADFTPILHRLRAHARRTVVYANDHTAAPYTALSDGEVREQDLTSFLLEGRLSGEAGVAGASAAPSSAELEVMRRDIVAEVVATVRAAGQPLPLEALADRAVRVLGHDRTVATGWGGAGSFRDLLSKGLPVDVRLSDQAPFYVFDTSRQLASSAPRQDPRQDARLEPPRQEMRAEMRYEPTREARFEQKTIGSPAAHGQSQVPAQPQQGMQPAQARMPMPADGTSQYASQEQPARHAALQQAQPQQSLYAGQPPRQQTGGYPQSQQAAAMPGAQQPAQQARSGEPNAAIRQSIARIHEACQAPPLAPPEYRALFEVMAEEITANNLAGSQTLVNIMQRARELGVEIRRDDVRFVLEVVSEPDPWFEQGASANLFASRFRNFVVARCRGQGLNLSSDELDLIEAWFGGSPAAQRASAPAHARVPASQPQTAAREAQSAQQAAAGAGDRWWSLDEGRNQAAESRTGAPSQDEEFPRIIRSRLRG
jgi:hypothetical protein